MNALKYSILFFFCLLSSAGDAFARPAQPVQVALRGYVGALKTIDVVIDGRPARLLFDTGAGVTSVTPRFAQEIGCAPWGQITAFRMNGDRVSFQRCGHSQVSINGFEAQRDLFVFDLNAVLPEGLPPIDGIAGLDLFDGETVTLVHGLSALRVESVRSQRRVTRGLRAGRIRLAREASGAGLTVFTPVHTARGDLWLLVDSGNLSGLRLSGSARDALGSVGDIAVGVDGAAPVEVHPEIVADLIYDGALNAEFIAAHDLTLDLACQRAWWRD